MAMKAFHHLKSQFGFFQHPAFLLSALEIWPKVSVWPEKQFYINNSPTKSPFPSTCNEFSHCVANDCHTPKPNENPWLGRKWDILITIITKTETCEGLLAYYGELQLKWAITCLINISSVFECSMAKIYDSETNPGGRKKPPQNKFH